MSLSLTYIHVPMRVFHEHVGSVFQQNLQAASIALSGSQVQGGLGDNHTILKLKL